MRSKFSLLGHPLHPVLVTFPIGLLIWAFIADIVYVAGDRDITWYNISFWSATAGIVTALVAALPGFGDYLTQAMRSDARAQATLHMILNLAVIAAYVVAMLLMLDTGATEGGRLTAVIVLHAVGVGMLALSGWLGGEMVYRHHLAIIPDAETAEAERVHHVRPGRPSMGAR